MASPAAVLSILVRAQGAQVAAGQLNAVDKAGRNAGAGLSKTEGHAKRATKSFSVMGAAAKSAGVLIGGAGLVKGLQLMNSEYREAQKVGAQTNAVLKSTGRAANVTKKQIEDLAQAISTKSGIDDEAIQKGENLLLTFRDIRNETGKGNDIFNQATRAITDVSVAMDQGMKQSAVQVGKALNDPVKGMTALRRIGVTFTADQVKTVSSLVATGNKLAAQKLILRELNKEFAGSAAAQATAGDKLKVAWNNLAEAAGGVLVPQLDKLAVFLTNVINQAVRGQGIAKFLVPAFFQVKQSVMDLTAVLGPFLSYIGPRMVSAFQSLPTPIKAVTIALGALGLVLAVSSPLMAGLTALAAAAVVIHRNWSTISPIINSVRDSISAWAQRNQADIAVVMKAIRDVGAVVRAVFQTGFPVAAGIARRTMAGLSQAVAGSLQMLRGALNVFLALMHGDWARAWGGLKDVAAGGLKTALGTLRAMTAPFREVGSRIVKGVLDGLSLLGHTILNKFKDAANFVISNVGNLFKGVGNKIAGGVGKINPFGDGVGKGKIPAGKGSAALLGANAALGPIAGIGSSFGLHVSSGRRPGAITSSGNVSYHSSGEAIDEAGPPAGMMAFFKVMKSKYGSRLAELIYGPGKIGIKDGRPFNFGQALNAQHMDHVHVALDTGKPGVGDGTGKRAGRFMGDGYGKTGLQSLWTRAGGSKSAANMAAAIALAESGGKSNASHRNTDGSIDRGLWQINSVHGALSTFSPIGNAKAAVKISSGGRNWNPWVTYKTGAYKRFLGGGGPTEGSGSGGRSGATSGKGAGGAGGAAAPAPSMFEQAQAFTGIYAAQAASTPGTADDVTAITAQRNVVTARIKKIRAALKKNLTPATRVRLQQELAQRIGEHAGYQSDLAGFKPTADDFHNAQRAQSMLTPGLEDDLAATQSTYAGALQTYNKAVQGGDPRKITDAATALKSAADDLQSVSDAMQQAAVKNMFDWSDANIALAGLTDTLDDDKVAMQARLGLDQQMLQTAMDNQDPAAIAQYATAVKNDTDAIKALNEAVTDQTEVLRQQNDLLQQQLDAARALTNVSQSDYRTLAQAIASVASGQIGGKVGLGFMTPGFSGGGSRY